MDKIITSWENRLDYYQLLNYIITSSLIILDHASGFKKQLWEKNPSSG